MPSSAWSSDVCSSDRSEEHTSELQSLTNLVCRLLLEKKKNTSDLQSLTKLGCRGLLEKNKHEHLLLGEDFHHDSAVALRNRYARPAIAYATCLPRLS